MLVYSSRWVHILKTKKNTIPSLFIIWWRVEVKISFFLALEYQLLVVLFLEKTIFGLRDSYSIDKGFVDIRTKDKRFFYIYNVFYYEKIIRIQ